MSTTRRSSGRGLRIDCYSSGVTQIEAALIGGHPIDFLPDWIAQTIRVALLAMSCWIIGITAFSFSATPLRYLPWTRKVAWVAVSLFVMRSMLFQINNFDAKMPWETLVLVLPGTVLAVIALHDVVKNHDRASVGYSPR